MHAIYAFLSEPAFEHGFSHVDCDVTEFDERADIPCVARSAEDFPRDCRSYEVSSGSSEYRDGRAIDISATKKRRNLLGVNGYDAGFVCAQHQPIAQFSSGSAVAVVVVLDLPEH